MKHDKYKELLELNVLGELSNSEEVELENHLFECSECNEELVKLKKLYSVVSTNKNKFPTELDLLNARKKLFNTINAESTHSVIPKNSKSFFSGIFTKKYQLAFGGLALILMGLFIGYLLFNSINPSPKLISNNVIDLDKLDKGDIIISDIILPNKFSENGNFEFKLADNKSGSYSGNLNDIVVQKLLASALNKSDNPGFKIKTANIISELITNNFIADDKIKNAFINSLKTDKNPGVRKGALKALVNFPYDNKIREALLYTLENDQNASNRIDAINVLLAMNFNSNKIDSSTKSKLEQSLMKEDNQVIKFKTARLLIGEK